MDPQVAHSIAICQFSTLQIQANESNDENDQSLCQFEHLYRFFDARDYDGRNGELKTGDFRCILSRLYFRGTTCSVMEAAVRQMDSENQGYITLMDFTNTLMRMRQGNEAEKVCVKSTPAYMGERQMAFVRGLEEAPNAQQLRWWPPPKCTVTIVLINLAAFMIYYFHVTRHPDHIKAGDYKIDFSESSFQNCFFLVYTPKRRREIWRFLTYSLVHANFLHLINNTLTLLLTGWALENNHGIEVLYIYICGVIAGSLGVSAFDTKYAIAGASGGACALATANLACLCLNWTEFRRRCYTQSFVNPCTKAWTVNRASGLKLIIARLTMASLIILMDIYSVIYKARNHETCRTENTICKTSYTSHFCGMFAGFITGFCLLQVKRGEDNLAKGKRIFRKHICPLLIAVFLFVCFIYNISGEYPNEDYCPLYLLNHTTCDYRDMQGC